MRTQDPFLCLTLSAHGDGAAMFIRTGGPAVRPGPDPPAHAPALPGDASLPGRHATEWLGHADPETTLIYAHVDTEMKRQALEKANIATTHNPLPTPLWHGREDIIQRLCGLKD